MSNSQETPLKLLEAIEYSKYSQTQITRLKKSLKITGASDGSFTTKESIDKYKAGINLNKVTSQKRIDEILESETDYKELIKVEKRLKNRQLEIDILKKENELIEISLVKEFWYTHGGNIKGLLNDQTNALTPKLYELFKSYQEEGASIAGSIKKILSEYNNLILQAISNGDEQLEEIELIDKINE